MNPAPTIIESLMPLPVLLPLLGAGLALVLAGRPNLQRTVSVSVLVAVVAISAVLVAGAAERPRVVTVGSWPAPLGITLVADQLSTIMLLTSMTVTLLVFLYAIGQGTANDDSRTPVSIFHPTYLVLAAGVANAFLSGDLFNLYVGFEVLLMASYVLLTLGGTRSRIRAGLTYVVVNVVSSLVFLAGIALVYAAVGTLNLAQISVRMEAVPAGTQLTIHLVLLTAFGIKAAVFPLSAWLPDSYPTAAAPVTAVFAGLLTKVGVYSIIRTETLLFPGDSVADDILLVAALATMVIGALGAIAQDDIKRVLSFTLVSHIGYMIFGVALTTPAGVGAAIFYVVHHITVQATLFCVAGLIERLGGSTSTTRLAGLAAASPMLAVLYFVPAINLGGIPPLSGFVGKLGLVEAGVQDGSVLAWLLVVGSVLTSLLTLYAMAKVWVLAFWRPVEQLPAEHPDDADGNDDDALEPADDGDDPDDHLDAEDEDDDEDEDDEPVDPESLRDGMDQRFPVLIGAGRAGEAYEGSSRRSTSYSGAFLGAAVSDREGEQAPVRLPRVMTAATAGLVVVGVALTVAAGPLYTLTDRAAADLTARTPYITAVFAQATDDRVTR